MNPVTVHEEVKTNSDPDFADWNLCFQKVTYNYDDGEPSQDGYRFIWRRPNGKLQAARGQARIPSAKDLFRLLHKASGRGWFDLNQMSSVNDEKVDTQD